jgi:hypothetical protein
MSKGLRIRNFDHAKSFDQMGKVLYHDKKQGITIRAGNIFEAQTVKGNTNLIVTLRVIDGFMYYCHGDKVKKVKIDNFVSAVEHGDLQPRQAKEIDTERLTMATIGLDAVVNRRTGEEQIMHYGDGAEERFLKDKGGA